MQLKKKQPRSIDLIFKAFSDPTRLRILNLLQGKDELCVCDIIGVVGGPQTKISRHLAYLRRAGLVEARKNGLWMHYRLRPAATAFHRKLLECLACCQSEMPQLERDRVRLCVCRCKSDEVNQACCE